MAIATGENYCIRCLKWTGDPDKLEFHRGNRLLEWQAHSAQRLDRTSQRDPAVAGEACSYDRAQCVDGAVEMGQLAALCRDGFVVARGLLDQGTLQVGHARHRRARRAP